MKDRAIYDAEHRYVRDVFPKPGCDIFLNSKKGIEVVAKAPNSLFHSINWWLA